MNTKQPSKRMLRYVVSAVLTVAVLSLACAPGPNPSKLGEERVLEEGTPTVSPATPAASSTEDGTPIPEDWPRGFESRGTIKFIEWDDNAIALYNYITGYIISHGYLYDVELVEMGESEYQTPLQEGQVDVAMASSKSTGWYQRQTESGTIIDVGTLFTSKPDIRIIVHSSLKQRAPELVQFLGKITPGDEVLDYLVSRMTGGRIGVRANVAALMFLKNNEDTWTQWVPPDVAKAVKKAIEEGKTSLNRRAPFDPGVA